MIFAKGRDWNFGPVLADAKKSAGDVELSAHVDRGFYKDRGWSHLTVTMWSGATVIQQCGYVMTSDSDWYLDRFFADRGVRRTGEEKDRWTLHLV